jgi:hypothetical protein
VNFELDWTRINRIESCCMKLEIGSNNGVRVQNMQKNYIS